MKEEQVCFRCGASKQDVKKKYVIACCSWGERWNRHLWIIDGKISISTKSGKTKVIKSK